MNQPRTTDRVRMEVGRDGLRLLQLTDCHIAPESGTMLQQRDNERLLHELIQSIRRSNRSYDAALITGDLADRPSAEAYRRLREELLNLGLPCFCIPGNHDDPDAMRAHLAGGLLAMPTEVWTDSWQIVFLDSQVGGKSAGFLDEQQFARLDSAAEAAPDSSILIVVHHHPIPCGSPWMDAMMIGNADRLMAFLAEIGPRVKAVVFGHIHQELDAVINGVRFLGAPSTCRQFVPRSESFAVANLPPGYRWIELDASGTLTTGVEFPKRPTEAGE
ncbi:MAG: metallophosphoesterase [Methylotetracoccus sp.]